MGKDIESVHHRPVGPSRKAVVVRARDDARLRHARACSRQPPALRWHVNQDVFLSYSSQDDIASYCFAVPV